MDFELSGTVWEWRGPAPYYFVTVPADIAAEVAELAREVTYGWGMIPVRLVIGGSQWETSLWPKDGGYVVPLRAKVRRAEGIEVDDVVEIGMLLQTRDGRFVDQDDIGR